MIYFVIFARYNMILFLLMPLKIGVIKIERVGFY